jgi:DNA-binding CsgD family transcriptional regulator
LTASLSDAPARPGLEAWATLLERSEELAHIESVLEDARSGRGRFLVIEGPAGIGKTALLAAARGTATDEGMLVLRSRGTELERDFAFGVVRQLFESPLASVSELERAELLQSSAGVAAGILGLAGEPAAEAPQATAGDLSFAILHGLYWLCANLAAARPLCIVVDDAHWADAPSLRYLAYLLPRLEELDVALVVATRPCDAGTDPELLASVVTDPNAELVRLQPLTQAAIAELVELILRGEADPVFVDACLRATHGTPFLIRVLLDALREGGIAPNAEAARHVERIGARGVGRSIRLRLRRLPEHAGRLAHALAVLEQGDLLQAAQLAGLDDVQATDAADILVTAGILASGRPLTFSHPIVRSGIYTELATSERARAHRTAARLLAELPGSDERVAQHLLVSEPAGDEWVVERLTEAAAKAGKRGAPETQAAFLRRVLSEPPAPERRFRLLLDLGMAEASAGLPCWEAHLQEAAELAPDAAAAADATLVLAHALTRAQRFGEAVDVLDRASASLDSAHSDLALQLEIAAVLPATHGPVASPSLARRGRTLRKRAAGQAAPSPELLAVAGWTSALANERAEIGADLVTRALAAGEGWAAGSDGRPWFSSAAWLSQATFALLWLERYAQLGPILDDFIAQARSAGDSSRLGIGLANRGWVALRRGDLSAAESDARTALAAIELPAPPMCRVLNATLLVETLVDQGKLAAAEEALAPIDLETESGSLIAAVLLFVRGRLRVAQARTAEGLDDFLAAGALLTQALVSSPGFVAWRSEAALAQLALGDHDSAQRLADEELQLARAFGAPRALGLAKRAAGLVAGGDHGASLLREAVDEFDRGDARLERARALADLGAMLRRRNRRAEARELLREAVDAAHRCGATLLAAQAETELRATGARPRRVLLTGIDSLTASERRIAELAGEGFTNREIAQTLFVTSRTVEGHLTSVFRKLQLDSRTELASALGAASALSA